jgi:PAS domain S-box-containing protein
MPDRSDEQAARELAALVDASDDAIIGTDLQSAILSWNPAAERLFQFPRVDAIGRSILLLFPADRAWEEEEMLRRVRAGERLSGLATVRRRKDGTEISVSVTIAPVRASTGEICGTIRIARDITARQRAEHAGGQLAAIVASSDDAIVSKDLQGTVTSWNRAAERMFGYTAPEIVGQSIRAIIPADRQGEEDHVLACIKRGEKVDHFDTVRRRKDGGLVSISLTVSPILDEHGTVIGASKIARDISDRQQFETERAHLLQAVQVNARVTETLNEVGRVIAATLDRDAIVQAVTDAAVSGTHAEFGAFFYNVIDPRSGDAYQSYTLSGDPKEAFASFPGPRATAMFGPTFRGEGPVRLADVTADPRYAQSVPDHIMPPGHRPVRSYLAVPVKSRSGEVLGGLFFGHSQVGRFTEEDERLAAGIAVWASVALENARLYLMVQDAARLKDEFLATLSHELRTPLNAILGYARMVRSGVVPPDGLARALDTIQRNAQSLSQIVEDILDVARIVAGKIRLNVQPVDLPAVIRAAVESMVPAADAKGIRVAVIMDPRAAPISGDPERLQQVVWNLMSNAVKFTPHEGRVEVRLERVNSHVEIVVSDTGRGVRPDFLPHIFERFRQADAGVNREIGGLGLGLSIARQLIELHGGTIVAASPGEGQGTTFLIKLPLRISHPIATAGERIHPLTPLAEQSDMAAAKTSLRGVRVLAVDDDRDALALVREILEAAGAYVAIADAGTAALEALDIVKPDVLVLDLGMPGMDGFELIARIRSHADPVLRETPAAALTAFARSEDRVRSLQRGFQLHLSKPIEPAELVAATAALAKRTERPPVL